MNGVEHYLEAERLIENAAFRDDDGRIQTHGDGTPMVRADMGDALALAQVHATLALAIGVTPVLISSEGTVNDPRGLAAAIERQSRVTR